MKRLVLLLLATIAQAVAASKPNFIVILADDMGWNDARFCGNAIIDTLHLDQLAQEGMVFTQAYASAPNCAPTRACLLTGQYPPRHGVYTVVDDRHAPGSPHHKILSAQSRESLPTESITLAESLKPAGYATALFGMWNLGRGRTGPANPTGQGFDVYMEPKELGFKKDAYRDAAGRYSPDILTDAALKWVESVQERPFFLYLAFHDVHAPFDPMPALLAKYKARTGVNDPAYAATIEAMDANVGRVLDALNKSGLAQNTYVIFTSDNGGTRQYVTPLRGGKGTLYQGGIRVSAILRGPGIPSGRHSPVATLSMDWYPTVLDLAGVQASDGIPLDGCSLAPIAKGQGTLPARDVFWHFPCYIGGGGPCSAMLSGDWKLIEFFESGTTELYNLSQDPGEKIDLTASEPGRSAELLAKLHVWQDETQAPRPNAANSAYDPSATGKPGRQDQDNTGGKDLQRRHPKDPSQS